jgi:hypothetical protein
LLKTKGRTGPRCNLDLRDAAPRSDTVDAIKAALTKAGVEFIPENGGGAGVRLMKKKRKP